MAKRLDNLARKFGEKFVEILHAFHSSLIQRRVTSHWLSQKAVHSRTASLIRKLWDKLPSPCRLKPNMLAIKCNIGRRFRIENDLISRSCWYIQLVASSVVWKLVLSNQVFELSFRFRSSYHERLESRLQLSPRLHNVCARFQDIQREEGCKALLTVHELFRSLKACMADQRALCAVWS